MELNLAEIFIVGWDRLEAIFEGRKLPYNKEALWFDGLQEALSLTLNQWTVFLPVFGKWGREKAEKLPGAGGKFWNRLKIAWTRSTSSKHKGTLSGEQDRDHHQRHVPYERDSHNSQLVDKKNRAPCRTHIIRVPCSGSCSPRRKQNVSCAQKGTRVLTALLLCPSHPRRALSTETAGRCKMADSHPRCCRPAPQTAKW